MAAFRYPTKRSKEIKFTAKDFAHLKKALGHLIAEEESIFVCDNLSLEFTPKQRKQLSAYRTTLRKLAVIRKKK